MDWLRIEGCGGFSVSFLKNLKSRTSLDKSHAFMTDEQRDKIWQESERIRSPKKQSPKSEPSADGGSGD